MGLGLVVMVAMGLVLLFLLTQATNNRELYERNYARLFAVNVVVAALLLLVIVWIAVRLIRRLVQKKFGSRLLVKLAAIFALAGFAPGMLIYVVSYQFVSRSIESWFDVKVEGALDAGLNLGRITLETLSADLAAKTRAAAAKLSDTPDASAALPLERVRDAMGADDLILWSASGRLIAAAGQSRYQLNPERPAHNSFGRHGRNASSPGSRVWTTPWWAPAAQARIKALALVTSDQLGSLQEPRYLLAAKALPDTLVANALAVHGGQPRVPGAGAGTRRPAPHVHRHAHAESVSGGVRCRAAGGGAGQPDGAALAAAGRWRAPGGRRRPDAQAYLAGQG